MLKNLHKLLFLLIFSYFNIAFADNEAGENNIESSQLDEVYKALEEFTRFDTKNNFIYEQRKREMLDSIEVRFHACDPDNDNTLDVYETTICLPQVARQFRHVDINNDNVISLDELSILARDFHNRNSNQNAASKTTDKLEKIPKASLPNNTPISN